MMIQQKKILYAYITAMVKITTAHNIFIGLFLFCGIQITTAHIATRIINAIKFFLEEVRNIAYKNNTRMIGEITSNLLSTNVIRSNKHHAPRTKYIPNVLTLRSADSEYLILLRLATDAFL